jgi:hypothetical protein
MDQFQAMSVLYSLENGAAMQRPKPATVVHQQQ